MPILVETLSHQIPLVMSLKECNGICSETTVSQNEDSTKGFISTNMSLEIGG